MENITKAAKITRVMNAVAAGVTEQNSTSVDMKGFESVTFILTMGAITAGAATSVEIETSSDNSVFDELLGSGITIADDDDNQAFVLEVVRPQERYVRCTVHRATQNSAIDSIVALQTAPAVAPVTQPATTTIKLLASPAEGAA